MSILRNVRWILVAIFGGFLLGVWYGGVKTINSESSPQYAYSIHGQVKLYWLTARYYQGEGWYFSVHETRKEAETRNKKTTSEPEVGVVILRKLIVPILLPYEERLGNSESGGRPKQ